MTDDQAFVSITTDRMIEAGSRIRGFIADKPDLLERADKIVEFTKRLEGVTLQLLEEGWPLDIVAIMGDGYFGTMAAALCEAEIAKKQD